MNNNKLHLLVVEDDEDDYVLLSDMLRGAGREIEVDRAATLPDALAHVERQIYDLCFFDYRLGSENGLDLLREIREHGIDSPVIFLTGQGDEEIAVQAMKAGAIDYMLKSKLTEAALARAIRYAINLHKNEELLREAQRELQANERRFRALVEHSYGATHLMDADGKCLWASHSAGQIMGYTPEELVGRPAFGLVHPEDVAQVREILQRLLSEPETPQKFEFRCRHKDGSWRWLEASAGNRLTDPDVAGIVMNYRDVSQRKRTEEALRHSRDEWEVTFDSMSEAVSFHDAEYHILRTNQAFRRLVGGRQAETCSQLVHGTEKPPEHCPMAKVLVSKKSEAGEFFEPNLNRMLSVRVDPVLNGTNEVVSVVHVIQDITERHELQMRLQHAEKMEAVGQLAGGIAHDFNNLLMVITSYAELMLDWLAENPALRHNAQEILKAGRRAASLTQQLLAFGRKQVLAPRVLDLNASLQEIGKLLPRLIGEDIELAIRPGEQLWPVKADPVQMEQVIMNLASNARDAMPRGGKLVIETCNAHLDEDHARQHAQTAAGDYVLLAVSDTGVGIDPKAQPHIFEPFFTTKEKGKGTGLGLASVYGIVEQSGGTIWVYSEVDHGTTFKIYLPRVQQAQAAVLAPQPEHQAVGGSETLLLVEDEDAVRQAAYEFLESCGYTVLQARSGTEAIALAERFAGEIDLLITDVVMPGMSGRELSDAFLTTRPRMKVLYISGYTEGAVLQRGVMECGGMFLQKPFSLNVLGAKVREALAAKNAKASLPAA